MIQNSKLKIYITFVSVFAFASIGMAQEKGKSKSTKTWERECSLKLEDLKKEVEDHTFIESLFNEAEVDNSYRSGTYQEITQDLPAKALESLERLYLSQLSETKGGTPEFPEARKTLQAYAYTCKDLLNQFKEITPDLCSEPDAEYAANALHVLKLLKKKLKSIEQKVKSNNLELVVVSRTFEGSFDDFLNVTFKAQNAAAKKKKQERLRERAANKQDSDASVANTTSAEPNKTEVNKTETEVIKERKDNEAPSRSVEKPAKAEDKDDSPADEVSKCPVCKVEDTSSTGTIAAYIAIPVITLLCKVFANLQVPGMFQGPPMHRGGGL
jgi:hypothetical protein